MPATSQPAANVLLDAVQSFAEKDPGAPAYRAHGQETVTYGELWSAACALARGLAARIEGRDPILVLGPKRALTVEAFLACLMSGHAYVPIDVELPARRVADIAGQMGDAVLLATCEVPAALAGELSGARIVDARALLRERPATSGGEAACPLPREAWVQGEQTQYIIFTSGSTGRPKGIEVTEANVAHFAAWMDGFPVVRDGGRTFLDQAHYSFDLSEYELVGALTTGGCLRAVDAAEGADFRALFADLATSGVEVWVSTPSFADLCLADSSFGRGLLPKIGTFIFCGETLRPATACKLRERFGEGVIIANTYGPTESTVAVTYCEIGARGLEGDGALPVGRPREGTDLRIVDHQTGESLPLGQTGEIVICGDTVARGYFRDAEKTKAAFFASEMPDGRPMRAYRTGDLGYLAPDGMLHCVGRLDSLVKLNGYRIELGEVEGALAAVDFVRQAAVVADERDGRVRALVGFAVVDAAAAGAACQGADAFGLGRELRERLAATLPAYMVPRRIRVIDHMPLNANGKADRRALAASLHAVRAPRP